ncbi:MAG: EpsG family protein [Sphaerochaeta sp.]|nr:EpsG family protein [Sphaerochaeta sp.]
MAFYMLNVAFLLVTLIAYFATRLGSVRLDHFVSGILFFAFLCMIAFRPSTVRDTIPYIDLFNYMDSYQFTFGFGRPEFGAAGDMEIGFANLCKVTSLISSSYQVFFFIVALLTVGVGTFAAILISTSMNDAPTTQYRVLPAFILFVSYYGFMYTGIVLRSGLAISFCMLSYAMIYRKRYIFGLISFLLAFSFHSSALIFLIVLVSYLFLPTVKIRTYRIISLSIMGLYILRVFDFFVGLVIQFTRFLATQVSFPSFIEYHLSLDYRGSSFLKTILFFMVEFVYLTFCFNDTISKQQKKNLNAILVVSIIAGLFGFLPIVTRVIDVLFVVIIPPLLYTLIGTTSDEHITLGKTITLRKLPLCVLGIGVIAVANFLLFSRWAGYLELVKETLLR